MTSAVTLGRAFITDTTRSSSSACNPLTTELPGSNRAEVSSTTRTPMPMGTDGSMVRRLFTGTGNLLLARASPWSVSLASCVGTAPVIVMLSVPKTAMIGAGLPSGSVLNVGANGGGTVVVGASVTTAAVVVGASVVVVTAVVVDAAVGDDAGGDPPAAAEAASAVPAVAGPDVGVPPTGDVSTTEERPSAEVLVASSLFSRTTATATMATITAATANHRALRRQNGRLPSSSSSPSSKSSHPSMA